MATDIPINTDESVHTHSTSQQPGSAAGRPGSSRQSFSSATNRSTRPQGFAHTPSAKLPSFTSVKHEPESSALGRYISYGVIGILIILLIFQVASKGGLRTQVRTLQAENDQLTDQVAQLQATVANQETTTKPTDAMTTTSNSPATVLQTYPIQYRENQYQKIGQTISTTTTAKISGVTLRGIPGSGSAGQLALFKKPNTGALDSGRALVTQSFDTSTIPSDSTFFVEFKKPVTLEAGTQYFLVVATTKKDARAEIGYQNAIATAPGTMWVYSRRLTEAGEVLSNNFSWQEVPGYDLFFQLQGGQ